MSRRRNFAHEAYVNALKELGRKPKPIRIATAIESAIRGGYCPSCGKRFGRAARTHFENCEVRA